MKKCSRKGVALITSYIIIAVLVTTGLGFVAAGVNELNHAQHYLDSATAFWAAESGLTFALANLANDPDWDPGAAEQLLGTPKDDGKDGGIPVIIPQAPDNCDISVAENNGNKVVTSIGTVGAATRILRVELPMVNDIFTYTMAAPGNMRLSGFWAKMTVNGSTRLGGNFQVISHPVFGPNAYEFEDKLENLAAEADYNDKDITIVYPDEDENGTPNQFSDFVAHYDNLISDYAAGEVVIYDAEPGSSYVIHPASDLEGVKILYVRGAAGDGDVDIIFEASSWADDQDLTIISTGTVHFIEPIQNPTNSRLSIIAWEGYQETSALIESRAGSVYSHGDITYIGVADLFTRTSVNVFGYEDINCSLFLSDKVFDHNDAAMNGDIPVGFGGLLGTHNTLLTNDPISWAEIDEDEL